MKLSLLAATLGVAAFAAVAVATARPPHTPTTTTAAPVSAEDRAVQREIDRLIQRGCRPSRAAGVPAEQGGGVDLEFMCPKDMAPEARRGGMQ